MGGCPPFLSAAAGGEAHRLLPFGELGAAALSLVHALLLSYPRLAPGDSLSDQSCAGSAVLALMSMRKPGATPSELLARSLFAAPDVYTEQK